MKLPHKTVRNYIDTHLRDASLMMHAYIIANKKAYPHCEYAKNNKCQTEIFE